MRVTGRAVVPWHVMITTYSYFEADTGSPDRAFLRSIPFDVLALDEAHNIKNAASSRHRCLQTLIPNSQTLTLSAQAPVGPPGPSQNFVDRDAHRQQSG